ncbi:hypothetical protein RFI_28882 [Reticulomyxa filosa]|uniref:Uncharacterized protein n=1 Tax=Reticulomyxa filosa TaxID=46433 RepID=X6M646_RETFI|nr:hypothetical protein RFI_28882 [Reticulomyxa filosa]|eukprot:ETO08505.1 hypothetical protein RFI_28882 [Reticulomyxa filosa]
MIYSIFKALISYQKVQFNKKASSVESLIVKSGQSLQFIFKIWTKKEILKKKDMILQFRQVVETLQRWSSVCQDHRVLQVRGILKLITITDYENFEQLDEQNEDNIVTKKHHEPASSHMFSNKFINKAALNQIAKNYSITHNRRLAKFDNGTPVDNNDVNQQSMIWKVQDRTRTHYGYTHTLLNNFVIMSLVIELH